MQVLFLNMNGIIHMENKKEQIDFVVDKKFVDSLSEPWDSANDDIMKGERFIFFNLLYRVYMIYGIISQLMGKNDSLKESDIKKMKFSSTDFRLISNFKQEISIYDFIYDIMLNKIDSIKAKIENGTINISSNVDNTSLFRHAISGPSVWGFSYLSVSAILGRKEIFKYFLEKGANPDELIFYDTLKPVPIPLSVNECLLMNKIFQWYKSGKKEKLKDVDVNSLIDAIILASRIAPDIVLDVHLLDNGISVMWYWLRLAEMVKNPELLKRLIPLNPYAMKEILGISI